MQTLAEVRSQYAAELVKLLKALPAEDRLSSMAECLSLLDEAGLEVGLQPEKDPQEFADSLFSSPELSQLLESAQSPRGCLSPDELVQKLLPADGHLD